MSIASEITRLQGAKSDLKDAIEGKGVTVPSATKLDGYADLVDAISQGGGTLGTKTITSNGTYNASSDGYDGYSKVTASVPNSYSASDEGKVVSNGALVSQTTGYITENGTYTTTTNNEVIANVPNTYTSSDEGKVVSNGALVAQTAHADVTPTTSDQTIDTTTNNSIKVKGDADLVAENIKKDVEIFGVTGSYEGGGGAVEYFDVTKPEGVYTSSVTELADSVCKGRTGITKFIGNDVTVLRSNVFANCTSLQEVVLPKANNPSGFGTSAFQGCTALKGLVLPAQTNNCYNYFADGCSNMEYYDASPGAINQQNAFRNCPKLATFVIRKTGSVCTLNNINNFGGTPFASGGTGGTLYVPSDLVSSYQSASNWSTILGYANNQIKSIESTHTDPDAPIDLTLYYADGTPLPT